MKKLLLALALCLVSSGAWAQNVQCPTRATGDSTNACASTKFVQNQIGTSVPLPLSLANGGLGASQTAATANQIPVYPGSGGGAVPTAGSTWLNAIGAISWTNDQYFGSGRPWVDAKAAVGSCAGIVQDGVTDDTAALQCHINYVESLAYGGGGGIVYVPLGNISCIKTGPVILHNPYVRLVGASQAVTLSACGQDVSVVQMNTSSQRLENISVFGKGVNNDTGTFGSVHSPVVVASDCIECVIIDATVLGGYYPIAWFSREAYMYRTKVNEAFGSALLYVSGAVQVTAATVNAAGSGGTNGACVATVSGGNLAPAGISATLNITISGGAVSAINSVAYAGTYIYGQQPSSPATLSGCGLTGATVNLTTVQQTAGGWFDRVKADNSVVGFNITTPSSIPAWATGTVYGAGAIVSCVNSGLTYYLATQSGGTSAASGSCPVKNFGINITDNTVTWQLVGGSGNHGVQLDSGTNEFYAHQLDTAGQVYSNFKVQNGLGGSAPTNIKCFECVLGGSIYHGLEFSAGTDIFIYGGNMAGNATYGSALSNTGASHVGIYGGYMAGAYGANLSGSVDYNIITGVDMTGATTKVANSSTGTNNRIKDNPGYNPVGLTAGTSTGTSASTITAGPSPETHYITQSATFNAAVKSGSTTLCTVATATVPCVIELGPNESYSVTWTTTQPTYSKYVH